MKQTLLEMTQYLLSSMGSDEVNTLMETEESYEVALLLKHVYYDSVTELDLAEHETLFELIASNNTETPTVMHLPEHVTDVSWIEYNGKRQVHEALETYIQRSNGDEMQVVENTRGERFRFRYDTMANPTVFTSFDDNTMIFNAIDTSVDHTLQASKSAGFGFAYSPWRMEDGFIPELKARHFPYLLNRAKVRAFAEIQHTSNKEAASETRAQKLEIRRSGTALGDTSSVFSARAKYGRNRRYI